MKLLGFVSLLLFSCASSQRPTSTAVETAVPERAEPLELTLARAAGGAFELSNERGKAVLLIAFLMDDLRSHSLIRTAENVARAHEQDLVVVAISGDRHPVGRHRQLLQVWSEVLGLRSVIPVLADDAIRDGVSPLGSIEQVPTTFLLNRAGAISRRMEGLLSQQELEALVAPALPPRIR